MYLHLLKVLNDPNKEHRQIAFYHRNTSQKRKEEILADLKLPLGRNEKKILCVIATVSLGMILIHQYKLAKVENSAGVGVDIRVGCSVIFGLSNTFEGFVQEGGRSMRGGEEETQGQTGFSFVLHKGALGKEWVWKK